MVQSVPSADAGTLNAALARLGRNPRDVAALMDAGDAARALGDFDAAIGFYRRADELSTNNPRIKAGLAKALVLGGDPIAAIPVFAEAERAGARPQLTSSDRGLAHDLVGDNATAQRYYRAAMGGAGDEELRMRLAISQAIAGDAAAAEQTLMPLLRRQDKPAWRTRAFTLAIVGDTKEAVELANRILPPQLAQNMAAYLRYMPRLTKAQQAAAANLGTFPRAAEIGRDDLRIAAYSPARLASADAALIPRGEALGSTKTVRSAKDVAKPKADLAPAARAADEAQAVESRRKVAVASAEIDRVAPPEPKPTIERSIELPPVNASSSSAASVPGSVPPSSPLRTATATVQATPSTSTTTVQSPPPSPGFDLARVGGTATASPQGGEAGSEPGPGQISLSEIFADLGTPTTKAAPVSGAVDIRMIQPARPKPKEEAKPAAKAVEKSKKLVPPAHPSRIWVQIGVGRDKAAIAFDWRRYTRQAPELFKGRQAYVSEMGQTNRILAGPFATRKAANEFVQDLRKAGFDGAMPWTSPAGQVVDQLQAK